MRNCLYVMIGGGFGAILRYIVTTFLQKHFNIKHWATFCVNISGCFMIGLLFGLLTMTHDFHFNLIIVGLIGSYTTFSTFEYENIDLIAHEKYSEFIKYSALSCIFGFLAVLAGSSCAKLL